MTSGNSPIDDTEINGMDSANSMNGSGSKVHKSDGDTVVRKEKEEGQ